MMLFMAGLMTTATASELKLWDGPMPGEPNPLVIICLGRGYKKLAFNLEGTEVATWLNSIGVSAAILKYRVPDNREGALLDAQRALTMVREHSEEWNIDPLRVGMLGFSAGGHLTAASSNSEIRPDYSILIYPAYTAALDAMGIPVEMHLFAQGGHGFGLRPSGHPASNWPDVCAAWMQESGFLK